MIHTFLANETKAGEIDSISPAFYCFVIVYGLFVSIKRLSEFQRRKICFCLK